MIELEYFENIWNNHSDKGIMKKHFIANLHPETTDILIIGNQIYIIKEGKIYKSLINEPEKYHFLTYSNSLKFNYMLFEEETEISYGDGSKFFYSLIYFINILIILGCIYILKRTGLLSKKKAEEWKKTKLIENDDRVYG
jgi:hypothetical protein